MITRKMGSRKILGLWMAAGLMTTALCDQGFAQDETPVPQKKVSIIKIEQPKAEAPEEKPSDVELYCKNIAESAEEARIAWQTWNLVGLEAKVRAQIDLLEKKRAEYEEWVSRREKLLEEVEGHVVSIVSRMRPETAAEQLATADEETATGVLLKLKARVASSILDEMDPARAAQLTQSMVGFSDPRKQEDF